MGKNILLLSVLDKCVGIWTYFAQHINVIVFDYAGNAYLIWGNLTWLFTFILID